MPRKKKVKALSPSFNKTVLAGVAIFALLSGCSNAPLRSESSGPANEPPALPRDYENALALMQGGDYPAAVVSIQRFIEAHPGLAGPWLNLGIAYRFTGDSDAALEALSKAVELNPSNAAAYQQLGMLYRERGQFDAALESYDRALKLDPGYAMAHRNIGILYDLYLQRPNLALDHYRKYLELMGNDDPEVDRWVTDLQRRSGGAQARAEQ